MARNEDGFEDWDADFLDQLIKVEEFAISSANPTQHKPLPPQPPAAAISTANSTQHKPLPPQPPAAAISSANPTQHKPQPPQPPAAALSSRSILHAPYPPPQRPSKALVYSNAPGFSCRNVIDVSYSPPRELSQRAPEASGGSAVQSLSAQDFEIERLKKELGRVTNQLSTLEKECVDLRKERDKERLKSVKDSRNNECNSLKRKARSEESIALVKDEPGISPKCQNANAMSEHASSVYKKGRRTIGIQTDGNEDLPDSRTNTEPCISYALCKRLQSVWFPSHSVNSRSYVGKLLQLCAPDICALFGCLGLDIPLNAMESLERNHSARMTMARNIQSSYTSEAVKIFEFFSVLMMISDNMGPVEALLGVLVDLCSLENALIAYRSLRIMHVVLIQVLNTKRKQVRRENVMIEGLHPQDNLLDIFASEKQKSRGIYDAKESENSESSSIPAKERMNVVKLLEVKGKQRHGNTLLSYQLDLAQLFQAMCIIAKESVENQVQVEAVSIMNSIIRRSNAFSERERFGDTSVFDAVACLLRKENGLCLQNEAVQLLRLLVNCPKLLEKYFCANEDGGGAEDKDRTNTSSKRLNAALEGLADCIDQCGNSAQGINLCRSAVGVLALLAASGKGGLEIVLLHKLSNDANFLGLVLRALASEIDAEASETSFTLDTSKERALFMKEALILLNRLASHPSYSGMVLQILTSSRDMASLSIDVATRLSSEITFSRVRTSKSDDTIKHIRQSEVVDLAQKFRKCVYTSLGESV